MYKSVERGGFENKTLALKCGLKLVLALRKLRLKKQTSDTNRKEVGHEPGHSGKLRKVATKKNQNPDFAAGMRSARKRERAASPGRKWVKFETDLF